jgi:hypothetical protein
MPAQMRAQGCVKEVRCRMVRPDPRATLRIDSELHIVPDRNRARFDDNMVRVETAQRFGGIGDARL